MNDEPEQGDTTEKCADCGEDWTLEAGQRKWFVEKGFSIPRRCQPCRDKRRREREGPQP